VILLAGVAARDHAIDLVGLGIIAIGFGEWLNHRMEKSIVGGAPLTTFERKNRTSGIVLDVLGALLIFVGLYRLISN
jgi:hypothetical protein